MEYLDVLLVGYIGGAIVVAARLGLHMNTQLDRFDWTYNKPDIWASFVLTTTFWPLLLFRRPKLILNPRDLFTSELDVAGTMRTKERLRRFPPSCAEQVRYRPENPDLAGEFIFTATDIESLLTERLRKHPHLSYQDDGAILRWVHRHDDELTQPSDVPTEWRRRFRFVADELIRSGDVEATCLECGQRIPNDRLIPKDDHGNAGYNYNRVTCPKGHLLLEVETIHISKRTPKKAQDGG